MMTNMDIAKQHPLNIEKAKKQILEEFGISLDLKSKIYAISDDKKRDGRPLVMQNSLQRN